MEARVMIFVANCAMVASSSWASFPTLKCSKILREVMSYLPELPLNEVIFRASENKTPERRFQILISDVVFSGPGLAINSNKRITGIYASPPHPSRELRFILQRIYRTTSWTE